MVIIVMDLVKVTYQDITEFEELEYKEDLTELRPDKVELIGWMLKKDDKQLILAIGKSDDAYEHVYVIPIGCILEIENIK